MLSRFASHGSCIARASMLEKSSALCIVPARTLMHNANRVSLEDRVTAWEKAHELFNGPERDFKNFPVHTTRDEILPVRHGIAPETYFEFIGSKTGVSGPYVLPAVVLTTLMAKEIIVQEHNFGELLVMIPVMMILYNKVGPKLQAALMKWREEDLEAKWFSSDRLDKEYMTNQIADVEHQIWQCKGKKYLYETFQEHIDLQLEAEYRRRINEVHTTVQKKLDFAVALETTKRAFEHKHMADWIVEKAVKSITPQQEKESIAKCIGDLKALAAAAKA